MSLVYRLETDSQVRFGSKADISGGLLDVRYSPKADIGTQLRHVRYGPEADSCSATRRYSIASSARARNEGGTVRPSAFAVLRLITSSNLVGCSTGRSAGLVPLRILST